MPEERSTTYVAPPSLTNRERASCRDAVLSAVEGAARRGDHVVVVDMLATREIDASGLGCLILLQKRARERGMRTRLSQVSADIATLLDSTRLYTLFEVERRR
ncbi:MAG: STAS domain-containing protein [Gemmatimonadaceae bacterium]|nr:STAS domain-containing protein [Gemmatimonadaceae bacterium]